MTLSLCTTHQFTYNGSFGIVASHITFNYSLVNEDIYIFLYVLMGEHKYSVIKEQKERIHACMGASTCT